jgi:hypothetical protein
MEPMGSTPRRAGPGGGGPLRGQRFLRRDRVRAAESPSAWLPTSGQPYGRNSHGHDPRPSGERRLGALLDTRMSTSISARRHTSEDRLHFCPDCGKRAAWPLAGLLYEIDSQGRMKIESKESARARGLPSPDRAEACWRSVRIRPVSNSSPCVSGRLSSRRTFARAVRKNQTLWMTCPTGEAGDQGARLREGGGGVVMEVSLPGNGLAEQAPTVARALISVRVKTSRESFRRPIRFVLHPWLAICRVGPKNRFSDKRVAEPPEQLRFAYPSELDLLVRLSGMRLRERYGGWDRSRFTAASPVHVPVDELQPKAAPLENLAKFARVRGFPQL